MNLKQLVLNSALSRALVGLSARTIAFGRGMQSDIDGDALAMGQFLDWLKQLSAGTVLELGTRRIDGCPSTVRRHWVSPNVRYIACDFQSGLDVDVVADIEQLSQTFAPGSIVKLPRRFPRMCKEQFSRTIVSAKPLLPKRWKHIAKLWPCCRAFKSKQAAI